MVLNMFKLKKFSNAMILDRIFLRMNKNMALGYRRKISTSYSNTGQQTYNEQACHCVATTNHFRLARISFISIYHKLSIYNNIKSYYIINKSRPFHFTFKYILKSLI